MAEIDLEALAARVERLEGPCRETDRAIMEALALKPDYAADWGPRDNCRPAPFAYTGSLDAAMQLVPEGCEWMLESDYSRVGEQCAASVNWLADDDFVEHSYAKAATPALALCAAALKARAHLEVEEK